MKSEKMLQEEYEFERETHFANYNTILAEYKAKSIVEHMQRGDLLDIACGDGYITHLISTYFNNVVGIDASSTHLEKAKRRMPNATFHSVLIEDYCSNTKFSTITMIDLLEHLADPVQVLTKVYSLLSDNGRLIIHVPNAEAINRKIAVEMGSLESLEELSPFDINIAGHRRSYTLDTLTKDIENSGFKILKTGGIFFKMLSTAQMDWFLENGLWKEGGFGWGRVGAESSKDWKKAFCDACYEIGKNYPLDCNNIFVVATKRNDI